MAQSRDKRDSLTRRKLMAGAGAALAGFALSQRAEAADDKPFRIQRGRIKQSICSWCFKPLSVEDLCKAAVEIGYRAIELLGPEHFATLKKYGLVCAMTSSHGFAKGFADPAQHEECIAKLGPAIDATADAGFPNVITFSGITTKISKEDGIKNAVAGYKKIVGQAERRGVNLCIEMLACYRNRDWDGALLAIAKGRAADDTGSLRTLHDLYTARIAAFRETPPPESWDGVFALTTK